MTETKVSKFLILIAILALAGALALAGCGGSGGTTATEQGGAAGEEPNAAKEAEEAPAEETEAPAEEEAEEEPAEEEAEEPAEEAEEEAGGEEAAGGAAALAEGKTVFTTDCGSCHTLQAAGTSGTVGPDLDELEPDLATVEHQVINGGGPMPAFGKEGTLSPTEIKAVSSYVATEAGKG